MNFVTLMGRLSPHTKGVTYAPLLPLGDTVSTTPLANQLLRRICVQPPYFALSQLYFQRGVLSATAIPELPLGGEASAMSAAEVGRHAAIAGLCVAALHQTDDARRYYLAQHADYRGFTRAATSGPISFYAQLEALDKRQAIAGVTVELAGAKLAEVRVRYTILTESAFGRLFRRYEQPMLSMASYQGELAGKSQGDDEQRHLTVAQIPLAACAGHFSAHPALPVAVIMSQLSRLAGELMAGPYTVVAGDIAAYDLCWADEGVRFSVVRQRLDGVGDETGTVFACTAEVAGRSKAQMTLTLQPHRS